MELNFSIDPFDIFKFLRQIPYINVSKEVLIKEDLEGVLDKDILEKFRKESLLSTGVGREQIEEINASIIKKEILKSSTESLIASNPALMVILATIPADALQFISHSIRIITKLLYIYGLKDISELNEKENLIIFVFLSKFFNISMIDNTFSKFVTSLAKASKDNNHLNLDMDIDNLKEEVSLAINDIMKLLPKNAMETGAVQSLPFVGGFLASGLNLSKLEELCNPFNEMLYSEFFVEYDKLD